MGKKGKQEKTEVVKAAPEQLAPEMEIPVSAAPLPLLELDAQPLGEFLELCFTDRRLLEVCGELRLYSPGYRMEAMPPNQVARMLADEVRAAKDAQELVDRAIREAIRNPVLETEKLSDIHYRELLELFTGDPLQHLARVVWKALLEADEKLAGWALAAIDLGVESLDATAQAKKPPRKPQLPTDVVELRKELEAARKSVDRAEKEREAARELLAQSRAETAAREKALAEVREELSVVRSDHARAAAEVARLTAAGEGRALSDARRLGDENRSLTERLRVALEERDRLRLEASRKTEDAPSAPAALSPTTEEEPLPSAE